MWNWFALQIDNDEIDELEKVQMKPIIENAAPPDICGDY